MKKRNGIMDGLVLIVAGVLLLLNNFNMLPAGFWWALIDMWPVLIILFGLDLIAEHEGSGAAAYIIFVFELLLVLVTIGAAWQYPGNQAPEFLEYFPFIHVIETVLSGFEVSGTGISWTSG